MLRTILLYALLGFPFAFSHSKTNHHHARQTQSWKNRDAKDDIDDRPIWGTQEPAKPLNRNKLPVSGVAQARCTQYCQWVENNITPTTTTTKKPNNKPGTVHTFVVGGKDSAMFEFPHMVRSQRNVNETRSVVETSSELVLVPKLGPYFVQGGQDSQVNEFPHMVRFSVFLDEFLCYTECLEYCLGQNSNGLGTNVEKIRNKDLDPVLAHAVESIRRHMDLKLSSHVAQSLKHKNGQELVQIRHTETDGIRQKYLDHLPTTGENGRYGIQGGKDAVKDEFPHSAAIGFKTGALVSWNSCGGSLISEDFVLTAAHCTDSSLGKPSLVRLGALNVNQITDGVSPEDINIAQVFVHPDYKSDGSGIVYNDIALLRLERKVKFRKGVQPACLYDGSEGAVKAAVATGWGNLGFTDAPSDILQKVDLDIIPNEQCRRFHSPDTYIPQGIISSQVCAGVLAGGRDTCGGDSGGPLQVHNTRTFRPGTKCGMEIIGITSFGKLCAQANSPGVYTRVASYVRWIESIVWKA